MWTVFDGNLYEFDGLWDSMHFLERPNRSFSLLMHFSGFICNIFNIRHSNGFRERPIRLHLRRRVPGIHSIVPGHYANFPIGIADVRYSRHYLMMIKIILIYLNLKLLLKFIIFWMRYENHMRILLD